MNEEELTALAEKLIGQGLSDDEVSMHLDRARMGEQPEDQTSPMGAMAAHAADELVGYSDTPTSSGASRGGGTPTINAKDWATTQSRRNYLDQAEGEHPTASNVGTAGGILLPLFTELGAGAVRNGPAMVRKAAGLGDYFPFIKGPATVRTARATATSAEVAARRALREEAEALAPKAAPTPVAPRATGKPNVRAPKSRITDDPVAQQVAGAGKARGATKGTGETLPYYPRGGAAEQAVAPRPSVSAPQGPKMTPDAVKQSIQLARMMGQSDEEIARLALAKGVTPEELAAALGAP